MVRTEYRAEFGLNLFIFQRGKLRWAAHMLLMWGCIIAIAITFPLVFGWIHFETLPNNFDWYRAYIFGFPDLCVSDSFDLWLSDLSWTGLGVVHGYGWRDAGDAAAHERSRRGGVAAVWRRLPAVDSLVCDQRDRIDVDGQLHLDERLRLRLSRDYARDNRDLHAAMAAVRQVLPHLSAPGAIGRQFLQRCGPARRTGTLPALRQPFTSRMHVEDLIKVERQLGYRYEMKDSPSRALPMDLSALPASDARAGPRASLGA